MMRDDLPPHTKSGRSLRDGGFGLRVTRRAGLADRAPDSIKRMPYQAVRSTGCPRAEASTAFAAREAAAAA